MLLVLCVFSAAIQTGLSPPDGRDKSCFAAYSVLGLSFDPGRWFVI